MSDSYAIFVSTTKRGVTMNLNEILQVIAWMHEEGCALNAKYPGDCNCLHASIVDALSDLDAKVKP